MKTLWGDFVSNQSGELVAFTLVSSAIDRADFELIEPSSKRRAEESGAEGEFKDILLIQIEPNLLKTCARERV